jgi:membrane protease YdiL (CAAX protease family)
LGIAAALVLRAQGNLSWFGFEPSWKGLFQGVLLGVAAYAAYFCLYWVAYALFPEALQARRTALVAPDLKLWIVISASLLNPLFEEYFVSGYLITRLKQWKGPLVAVNASVAVRLVYHLYQGAPGIVAILPVGFIFAHWYVRAGRLWPLYVAHALIDFTGLVGSAQSNT